MKSISLPADPSPEIESLLEQAQAQDVIIQLADGRQFLLSPIDDFDEELIQTRRNQGLMNFLDQRSQQTQTISLDEVKRQLDLSDPDLSDPSDPQR